MNITIKVTECMDDGIQYSLFVDGKEYTTASIGTWDEETHKHMCDLMGVSVFGLLLNGEYAAKHKGRAQIASMSAATKNRNKV